MDTMVSFYYGFALKHSQSHCRQLLTNSHGCSCGWRHDPNTSGRRQEHHYSGSVSSTGGSSAQEGGDMREAAIPGSHIWHQRGCSRRRLQPGDTYATPLLNMWCTLACFVHHKCYKSSVRLTKGSVTRVFICTGLQSEHMAELRMGQICMTTSQQYSSCSNRKDASTLSCCAGHSHGGVQLTHDW